MYRVDILWKNLQRPRGSSKMAMLRLDKNGVPTIQSSIPMSLFGLGYVFVLVTGPMALKSYFDPAVYAVYDDGSPVPSDWRVLAIVMGVSQLGYLTLAATTAIFYFRRQRIARTLVMSMLVAGLIVAINETTWACRLADGDTEYIVRQVGPVIATAVVSCLWFAYFAMSNRVRAILAYPLAADEHAPS